MILLASIDAILNIAKSVLGIGALIFVHESGHFLVGRWCGVKAEAFSMGFGPVIWKWKPGETEYRLSAVPLGGYVKFAGENPDERGDRDPRSFYAATYPRKVAIMLAGVTMNVIAAFVLFAVTFTMGWNATAPVAGQVVPGMPAWEYGVKPGDEFVSMNGHRILEFTDIPQETAFDPQVDVVLRRDGVLLPAIRIPTRDRGEGLRQIGLGPASTDDGTFGVGDEEPDSPSAGFRSGDRVVAVDAKPVGSFGEAVAAHTVAGKDTTWTVERDDARLDVVLRWATKPAPRIGVELGARKIAVRREGPAYAAGLRTGDEPVRVGDRTTPTSSLFTRALADGAIAGSAFVRRAGAEVEAALPDAAARREFADSVAAFEEPHQVWITLPVGESPARTAGLPEAAHVIEADGDPIHSNDALSEAVRRAHAAGLPVTLLWKDLEGRESSTAVTPAAYPGPDLGALKPIQLTKLVREPNVIAAMGLGLDRTQRWVMRIFDTLRSIVTGRVSGKKLAGPIMIARGTYAQAKSSWGDFFLFLGMISMNLAVLNVLPVPLLDGGQLAVHTIERIRGRALPEKVLEAVQWTGLALILLLMAYVIRNDIVNLMS